VFFSLCQRTTGTSLSGEERLGFGLHCILDRAQAVPSVQAGQVLSSSTSNAPRQSERSYQVMPATKGIGHASHSATGRPEFSVVIRH
jgi:hypothetical protein